MKVIPANREEFAQMSPEDQQQAAVQFATILGMHLASNPKLLAAAAQMGKPVAGPSDTTPLPGSTLRSSESGFQRSRSAGIKPLLAGRVK